MNINILSKLQSKTRKMGKPIIIRCIDLHNFKGAILKRYKNIIDKNLENSPVSLNDFLQKVKRVESMQTLYK
ncbi:MAG: hypothetical protein LBL13_13020 [Bacteroidales bacterium]|jgi:hypothetical protein|nr:hypothetical protein [Bacteroidales bacterium]